MGEPPRLIQRQSPAKLRHHGTSALDDDPDDFRIRPVVLPAHVREVRDARDVPDPPAIHAVTADAVPVEQVHHDGLLLLRTAHPVPGTAVQGLDLAGGDVLMSEVLVKDRSPGMVISLCGGSRGGKKQNGENRRDQHPQQWSGSASMRG